MGFAICSCLAWGCGGNVVGNGTADASSDAGADAYSDACMISAFSYDQSCTVDTDCQEVFSGDYCSAAYCPCGDSAINVGALAKFNADISKAPLRSGTLGNAFCGCPIFVGTVLSSRHMRGGTRWMLFTRRHPTCLRGRGRDVHLERQLNMR
jgi:hypothetical protein